MAEALKRWDGSEWVTVAAVNRMVSGGTASINNGVFLKIIVGVPTAI